MNAEVFRAWITSAAEVIEANRDHLTQLDAAIGDADHGINLARGLTAVLGALDARNPGVAAPATPGKILALTGRTIIADVDLPALCTALQAALAGVQQLGAAREGDKTMVDALTAATRAFAKAIAEGVSHDDALFALAEAAAAAAVATIPMQALKGRASYLGPRSVGHEDPGAASTALILGALRDAARTGQSPHPAATVAAGVRGIALQGDLPRRRGGRK